MYLCILMRYKPSKYPIGTTWKGKTSDGKSQVFRAKEYYDKVIRGRLISERLDKALGKINYKLSQVKV